MAHYLAKRCCVRQVSTFVSFSANKSDGGKVRGFIQSLILTQPDASRFKACKTYSSSNIDYIVLAYPSNRDRSRRQTSTSTRNLRLQPNRPRTSILRIRLRNIPLIPLPRQIARAKLLTLLQAPRNMISAERSQTIISIADGRLCR